MPGDLHVAARRDRLDPVLGLAPPERPQPRAEAHEVLGHLHLRPLGRGEVTQLVEHHHHDEGDDHDEQRPQARQHEQRGDHGHHRPQAEEGPHRRARRAVVFDAHFGSDRRPVVDDRGVEQTVGSGRSLVVGTGAGGGDGAHAASLRCGHDCLRSARRRAGRPRVRRPPIHGPDPGNRPACPRPPRRCRARRCGRPGTPPRPPRWPHSARPGPLPRRARPRRRGRDRGTPRGRAARTSSAEQLGSSRWRRTASSSRSGQPRA